MPKCFNSSRPASSRESNRRSSSSSVPVSSSTQTSTPSSLTLQYARATQTTSYSKIWAKLHPDNLSFSELYSGELKSEEGQQLLAQILKPDRDSVKEALLCARSGALKDLMSTYFNHSEDTFLLCVCLHHNIHRLHRLYASLYKLFDIFPSDPLSLTQPQCDQVSDLFRQFQCHENPIPCRNSLNVDQMHLRFSQLKQELDCHNLKSRSRIRLFQRVFRGSGICLLSIAVGIFISAIVVASHALIMLVAGSFLSILLPSRVTRELAHLAQLDAASKGVYVLHNELNTIICLVDRLHSAVESDRFLVHIGLDGRHRHTIQEVLKQLQKNRNRFLHQLEDLDEHLCLFLAVINRARSLLHEEIQHHSS